MAGHGYVKHDPAIERWNSMREGVYKHFRFTSRASWISISAVLLIPGSLIWISAQTDMKYDWTGKRKDESLYRSPSK
ncbi:hypothetical protein DENSPDRAFT_832226 [Dentipellis sp. KUC8613]|nr:hypothetical protein DENSPDRAFT_832226 [Dentipellis sp. KUC8613]